MAAIAPAGPLIELAESKSARQKPLPVGAVVLEGGFLSDWRDPMLAEGIDHQWDRLLDEGLIERFELAAAGRPPPDPGKIFAGEARLYKWLEASSQLEAVAPNRPNRMRIDRAITLICAIAASDGYHGLTYPDDLADRRWIVRPRGHELFAAGHLIQAGIVLERTLGDQRLMRCAIAMADLIGRKLRVGQLEGYLDHPCCEMALVELWRHTGDRRHLESAIGLVELVAGQDLERVRGHAVCVTYFACALVDIYLETGQQKYWDWARRWWDDVVGRNTYLTGAVGGRMVSEAVGRPFELPHEGAYAESCAAIGMMMWAQRMLCASDDGQFADQLETCLYNAVLAGVERSGKAYFYDCPQACLEAESNPPWAEGHHLAGPGYRQREGWFFDRVACCPPNLARVLSQLPGYLYGQSDGHLWIHLYAPSRVELALPFGPSAALRVRTNYPYGGRIAITVERAGPAFAGLRLRIPAWSRGAVLSVNGQPAPTDIESGYAVLAGNLAAGDEIILELAMPVELARASTRLVEARGQAALVRGPLVYCLEGRDNPEHDLRDLALAPHADQQAELRDGPLGSIGITLPGIAYQPDPALYRRADSEGRLPAGRNCLLLAVPYALWGNRGPGQMAVWSPQARHRPADRA